MLTTKAFAVLSTLDVYKELKEKARKEEVARIKTEVYEPVMGSVPRPKQGIVQCNKPITRTRKEKLDGIRLALHKQELQEAAEKLQDLQYKHWAEASLRRHYEGVRITATAEELLAARTKKYDNPVKL